MTIRSVKDGQEWEVEEGLNGTTEALSIPDDSVEIDPTGLYELHLSGEELLELL